MIPEKQWLILIDELLKLREYKMAQILVRYRLKELEAKEENS
jgi:hypothetical protein